MNISDWYLNFLEQKSYVKTMCYIKNEKKAGRQIVWTVGDISESGLFGNIYANGQLLTKSRERISDMPN